MDKQNYIEHKRGDNFLLSDIVLYDADDVIVNLQDYTIRSQIRDSSLNLVSELTVEVEQVGFESYSLSDDDTSGWAVGVHQMDIQYTDASGMVFSTDTVALKVLQDITFEEPGA